MDAYDTVVHYHQRSKHSVQAYARGPETLDWDAQPSPFRRYEGAAALLLPLAAARSEAPFSRLREPVRGTAAAPGIEALGALFQLSFAVSAWKSNGIDRWAMRCNPSSGNLHPTEIYLLAEGITDLADGVHHYRADDHALELRAAWMPAATRAPSLYLALSSVVWREAWKYGERAFRYCQLDIGHAAACIAYAAALLGWRAREVGGIAHEQLGALLGLDRGGDFNGGRRADTERETPELLFALQPDPAMPEDGETDLRALAARARYAHWHGRASTIDPHPMYQWPVLDDVAAATARKAPGAASERPARRLPPLSRIGARRGAVETLLGRRSGQRYDGRTPMRAAEFFHLLDATLPRDAPPWQTLADPVRIALLLFVHRVEGLVPGLYLLLRDAAGADELLARLKPEFSAARRVAGLDHLDLRLLAAVEPTALHRIARAICCHQDIAATSCFALAMLAEFDPVLRREPAHYRALLRHAGLLGQALYLEAEALGYRGTGIGCFFDDALHALLGLQDRQWQSLYHFAIGMPVHDARIETTPAYAERADA